jgi:PKD repeat protein
MQSRHTGTRVLILLVAVAMAGMASAQVVSLDPAESALPAPGDTLTLTIHVANIVDLFGWQIDVAYDSAVLEFVSRAEGAFLQGAGDSFAPGAIEGDLSGDPDGLNRFVTIAVTSLVGGTDGSGELATATFTVVSEAATIVKLVNPIMLDSAVLDIPVEVTGAVLTSGPANEVPVAEAGPAMTARTGEPVSLSGAGSTDDGTITAYAWDFDDGSTGDGVEVTHIYSAAGTFTVTLTVTDDGGLTASDTVVVTVEAAPAAIREHTDGSTVLHLVAGLPDPNAAAHAYIAIYAEPFTVQTGQFLEYQITMFSGNPTFQAGVDLRTSDGSTLGDAVDQNGIAAAPTTDLEAVARDDWYHRQISLDALAGKTVTEIALAVDTDAHAGGLFRALFDNIQITDGTARLIDVYIDGSTVPLPTPVETTSAPGVGGVSGVSDESVAPGVDVVAVHPAGKLVTNWGAVKSE